MERSDDNQKNNAASIDSAPEKHRSCGFVIQDYLRSSMFDGFSEIVDENRLAMKFFWLLMASVASIVCIGLILNILIRYATQEIVQKVTTKSLQEIPAISVCIAPKDVGTSDNRFLEYANQLENVNYCALSPDFSDRCEIIDSKRLQPFINTTSAAFHALLNESLGRYTIRDPYWDIMPRPCILYGCVPRTDIPFESKSYIDDGDEILLCREFRATVPPRQGTMYFDIAIAMDEHFAPKIEGMMDNGPHVHVKIGQQGHFPQTFVYNFKNHHVAHITYTMRAQHLLKNCQADLFQTDENFQFCRAKFVYSTLGCCLCGGFTRYCPAVARCCTKVDVPLNFSKEVANECTRIDYLPSCYALQVKMSSLQYDHTIASNNRSLQFDYEAQSAKGPITEVELDLKFETDMTKVLEVKEYYEQTISSALGNIGGVLSLFIGGSIMAVIHVFYFFFGHLVVLRHNRKLEPKLKQIIKTDQV